MPTALIVLDVQKIYSDPESDLYCEAADNTIAQINDLVKHCEERGTPIAFVRHVHRRDASDLGRMFDYLGEMEEDFNFKEGSDEVE